MIINKKALNYIKKNDFDYIIIKSTLQVNVTGCSCSGGMQAYFSPLVLPQKGGFKDHASYIYENVEGINIYIGKSIWDKLNINSEITLKNYIFIKKLILINFKLENLNKL